MVEHVAAPLISNVLTPSNTTIMGDNVFFDVTAMPNVTRAVFKHPGQNGGSQHKSLCGHGSASLHPGLVYGR
jgi:hypothetical protein